MPSNNRWTVQLVVKLLVLLPWIWKTATVSQGVQLRRYLALPSPGSQHSVAYAHESASQRQSYIPEELESFNDQIRLICITAQFNVGKLSFLEIMLMEAMEYESTVKDVLLVTDRVDALQAAVSRLQLPLNISYYQGTRPQGDDNKYWLVWEHRKAIELAVVGKNYTTVMYMEDDTRVRWPTLVSWAIDTRLLSASGENVTRCFYRTEVRPADGGLAMLDYRSSINISSSQYLRLDMQAVNGVLYNTTVANLSRFTCGFWRNSTAVPCQAHRYVTAVPFPFQGMWIATHVQLAHFMRSSLWTKEGALAFNMPGRPASDCGTWGYPERSASNAVLGGLTNISLERADICSSCMLPYHPPMDGQPPRLPAVAEINHLRNAYADFGSIPAEIAIVT